MTAAGASLSESWLLVSYITVLRVHVQGARLWLARGCENVIGRLRQRGNTRHKQVPSIARSFQKLCDRDIANIYCIGSYVILLLDNTGVYFILRKTN